MAEQEQKKQSFADLLYAYKNRLIEPPGVAKLIGIDIIDVNPKEGSAVFSMYADKRHHNPIGTLHGGIFCDLADAAMGMAFASTLQPEESFTTLNLQINFLKSIVEGKITASASMVKRGKSIGYLECNIEDDKGNLLAKSTSTCTVLRK